jgi:hypothetical protein
MRLVALGAWLRHLATLVAMLFTTTIAVAAAPAQPPLSPTALADHLSRLARLTRTVLDSYIDKNGPRDPRYWEHGSFIATDALSCWACYDTAATAAAVLSREDTGNVRMRNIAVQTINRVIQTYQEPNGEFAGGGVTSGFVAAEIGVSYLELRPYLDDETQATWVDSMRRAADYLISSGDTAFYINGNVNLRQTEVMWLAWAATGERRFWPAYEHEWQFTIAPPSPRWADCGLRVTVTPARADASDGAGYLTESGGGVPGYDPSYTMVQLDTATELYVLTRDPRYLRLMNLLFNQERSRIAGNYVLNATGGTRKDDMIPFMSAAPAVLVLSGDRRDLAGFWLGQLGVIHVQYNAATRGTIPDFYKGTSIWLSLPVLAIEWPHGIRAAPCVPRRSVICARLFS